MRFATPQGFNSGDQFFAYLKDSFDVLYAEGEAGAAEDDVDRPALPAGRPAGPRRGAARFLDYVKGHDKVWLPRRIDIARHWQRAPPDAAAGAAAVARWRASDFVARFGGVFEHSPWIAERAYALELGPAHDSAGGLHNALCRGLPRGYRRRAARRAQGPPRPRRQARRGQAADRRNRPREQARRRPRRADRRGARALHRAQRRLSGEVRLPLHHRGRGHDKAEILAAFERRLGNDRATELATACAPGRAHRAAPPEGHVATEGHARSMSAPHLLRAAGRPARRRPSCSPAARSSPRPMR